MPGDDNMADMGALSADTKILLQKMEQMGNTVNTNISELKRSVEFSHDQIEHILTKVSNQEREISELKQSLSADKATAVAMTKRMGELDERVLQAEMYSRRSNLIIDGILETQNENIRPLLLDLFSQKLGVSIEGNLIDKCHRIGKSRPPSHRPILVRFTNHSTRDEVFLARLKLKDNTETKAGAYPGGGAKGALAPPLYPNLHRQA